MTLHRLFVPIGGYTYWWYAAIPNERRGKLHLLKVPFFDVQADLVTPPRWGVYDTESYRRRVAGKYVPASILRDGLVQRVCSNRQNARHWSHEYGPPSYEQRGVCSDCIRWQRENVSQVGFNVSGYPEDIQYRRVQFWASLNSEEQWVEHVRNRYYDGN